MARPILDDDLWALIEPLLPPPKPRRSRHPGRKPLDNRAVLTAILFILQTGLRWDLLPQEMGCGSGMSYWRRLRDLQAAGVWDELHEVLLARLRAADQIDWSRSSSTPLQSVPWALVKSGTQSHRPRATRFKAPPHYRSAGSAFSNLKPAARRAAR
jgi:transposase